MLHIGKIAYRGHTNVNLSASKVDCFYGCKRLFYYRHISPPFKPPRQSHFIIGNIAHKALEEFHKSDYVNSNKDMGIAFKKAIEAEKAYIDIKNGIISRKDLFTIKGMLKGYLEYYIRGEYGVPNILSTEKYFKLTINGVEISGRADRVDLLEGNGFCIVDYKTSYKVITKKEESESVQLPTYAMWIKSEHPKADRIVGRYIFLKHLDRGKVIDFEITDDIVEKAKEKYTGVNKYLSENTTISKFDKNSSYKYCGICEYKIKCIGKSEDRMAFMKTGDAVIEKIFCSCGQELEKGMVMCPKCGKQLVQSTPPQEKPAAPISQ